MALDEHLVSDAEWLLRSPTRHVNGELRRPDLPDHVHYTERLSTYSPAGRLHSGDLRLPRLPLVATVGLGVLASALTLHLIFFHRAKHTLGFYRRLT